ncbi:glycoside hydrolase family 30 protein [Sporofaciens sp. SGI.106]|uniref:glycoside hydrolase family 30 protein n=1 Tax=Sporofaciens sp. SGI.106 TaxID=3420568 RepID=UPI002A9CE151|nr:glycoside hydrolase family 30 beta sandwich domain-containing protein [Lachnoclostridium sp.]
MRAFLYTTTEAENFKENVITCKKDDGTENEVLNIYPEIKYQTFEGFGGALTDAAGYVFSELSEKQQNEMLETYFHPDRMGYTQVRIHMDSCDFSTHMYEADPYEEDETLEMFSFADTEKYIIPLLEAAEKKAGKKLKIMLSAWSPPAYMKTNCKRKKGGSLKPEYRRRWAEYLCRYIEEFKSRGYEVVRMSIQNEPKAVQEWDSCVYTVEEEKIFLRDYLAPTLKEHGLDDIEIFIWDHNKERVYERASGIIDETTDDLVDGVAFHWYSGDHFEALDLVRQMYPDKKLILSESCLEFGKYDRNAELENAGRLAHDMIGNLNHGMCGFYDWNILLDSEGGPNHTANYCEAPYMFDLKSKKLAERKCLQYYRHFACFLKPGAVRLASTRYTDKIDMTAWENKDGGKIFILLNRSGEEQKCHLRISGKIFTFVIPANSIVSGKFDEDTI